MSGATASWTLVRDEVKRRIAARIWSPGDPIPNEADLAREFGCARATVNRALRELAESGLLERKRRAGTRVSAAPVQRAMLRIPLIRQEIADLGLDYSYQLLDSGLRPAPTDIDARLDLEGSRAFFVRALHLGGARPFVLEERWVNTAAVPGIVSADLAGTSANEWLLANAPFADARLEISAIAAGSGLAKALDCDRGSALVRLDRQTWANGRQITCVILTYRPGYRIRSLL